MESLIDWSLAPEDATHWILTKYGAVWAKKCITEVTCHVSNKQEFVESLAACDNDNRLAPSFGISFEAEDIIVQCTY